MELDCDIYPVFNGSKWCQKTFDKDSVFKSCVNDDILEDIQELFPNVKTDDDCYNVHFHGVVKSKLVDGNGTVCICSTDLCNATPKTGIRIVLQIFNIIFVVIFLATLY